MQKLLAQWNAEDSGKTDQKFEDDYAEFLRQCTPTKQDDDIHLAFVMLACVVAAIAGVLVFMLV